MNDNCLAQSVPNPDFQTVVMMPFKHFSPCEVVDVWDYNLEEEFRMIQSIVDTHPFASIAAVFPRMVSRTDVADNRNCNQNYDFLKKNVDFTSLHQYALILTDANGNYPDRADGRRGWQFNFRGFDPARDTHAYETVQALKHTVYDIQKNQEHGIDPLKFAEALMPSGLVCNEEVTWVSFHSAFDCGFLVKMLTGKDLPDDLTEFTELVKTYFGDALYDVKHLMSHCPGLYGGLHQVAKLLELEVDPFDGLHRAAADSLLTWKVFEKIRDLFADGPEKFAGVIHGLEQA